MTNLVVWLLGTLLVVAGLGYGASRLGISQTWIIAGALVIVGLGLMGRRQDEAEGSRILRRARRPNRSRRQHSRLALSACAPCSIKGDSVWPRSAGRKSVIHTKVLRPGPSSTICIEAW